MEEVTIRVKPLSVNDAWQGKRFKTKVYLAYEKLLMYSMPRIQVPPPPLRIEFTFGFSNKGSDWDNPIKPLQDILQKKYGFDDKDVFEATVRKVIVRQGTSSLPLK